MLQKKIALLLITSLLVQLSIAQFCAPIGGIPQGAYTLCGNVTVTRTSPPHCVNNAVNVPGCTGSPHIFPNIYKDFNPAWFKLTCYQAGTFGFLITPNDLTDDYNWHLFDITGKPATIVFNAQQSVSIAGNWVGTTGITGASSTGSGSVFECHSDAAGGQPPISSMPSLVAGHTYLLLVSHESGSGGFTLSVGGGTADITDPVIPHIKSVSTTCPGTPLNIALTKKVRCSSLGTFPTLPGIGASEFTIFPALANVVGGTAFGCGNSYETDSMALTIDNILPAGNYELVVQNGFDGNTALDFCDQGVPVAERFPFVVPAIQYPHMDSIVQPGCSPNELWLYFKKPIHCSSISPLGSQFVITGTSLVTVVHANGYCYNGTGVGNLVRLNLAAPIYGKGSFQIKLKTGDDGNQLSDVCNFTIPNGETLNFQTYDTVNADFSHIVRLGCKQDTIDFFNSGGNDINSWLWDFDGVQINNVAAPRILYDTFGLKHVKLIVSNGSCSDTSSISILLDNELNVGFETLSLVCPGQVVTFKDSSFGHIVSRLWTFGNGNNSTVKSPPQQIYPIPSVNTDVIAQLSITDNIGCTKTASKIITLADICYVYVPGAFTPNNDGLNDYLYPLNVFNVSGFHFNVYNRYGELMFESRDPSNRWNGRFKGQVADPGAYVWSLQYIDNKSGKTIVQRGTSILIR